MQPGPVFFHVSRLRLSTVLAAAVALGAACGTAQAALITYDFAGTLDSVGPGVSSQVTIGEAFSGSWTVDDSVGPHMPLLDPGFPGAFNQFDALVSYHATIGSYSISLTGGPTELIRVSKNGPGDVSGNDSYHVQADPTHGLTGPTIGPFSPFQSAIDLQDSSNTVFNGFDISTHFPTNLNLASFDEARFAISFTSDGGNDGLSGPLSSLTVAGTTTAVPEPSTLCSLLIGIGALGLSRMRKAKAKSDGAA